MNNNYHKVEYWDSRLSGKKKLAVDGKVLILTKEMDNFIYNFKIGEYNCLVMQNEDEKPRFTLNNRDFNDILKDERTGKLGKDRQKYSKNKKNDPKRNMDSSESEYYKRALKYNGDNYVEGNDGEIYDIEEQRRRLEEFERKKKKEIEDKNKNKISNNKQEDKVKKSDNKERKYLKFVLNNETVRKNQEIIKNINDIFDEDNLLDLNDIDFGQSGNNNKQNFQQNNLYNNNNNDYNFGQMNKNMNNNGNNQDVINQFLSNMETNNNDFNLDNGFNNNNNYINPNIININEIQNQNNNNNNYNDDFNPFDD